MGILLSIVGFFLINPISAANEYRIGDIVILHSSSLNRRGVITELSPTSSFIEDPTTLSPYKSAHSIMVKSESGQDLFTLGLAEKVTFKSQPGY